ncbi:MAG: RNA polymerase factor sigma-54 [Terriglobales bacterium]|jgi:RNA polymerase sigma-54 factor
MVLLQHKLNVKLSQRQILTPGLVQMVSVLALNKLELKDMINAEMVENPVLEELEDAVPLLDDVGRQEEERDRLSSKATTPEEGPPTIADEKKDPFEEIDFGSFFQEYLDPGYRSSGEMEEIEKPSFENFLSKPGNLSDHLLWQLGAISVRPPVHQAAQLVIGNLNDEGYLIASDEELLGIAPVAPPEADVEVAAKIVGDAEALGLAVSETEAHDAETATQSSDDSFDLEASVHAPQDLAQAVAGMAQSAGDDAVGDSSIEPDIPVYPKPVHAESDPESHPHGFEPADAQPKLPTEASAPTVANNKNGAGGATAGVAAAPARIPSVSFTVGDLHEALEVVRQFDPPGIACRDLRECLLYQLRYHLGQLQLQLQPHSNGHATTEHAPEPTTEQVVKDAIAVVDQHLRAVTLKQFKEIGRAIGRPIEAVLAALDYVRTLDPRPGLRYNKVPARLIEPDVAFVKHGDEWLVIMNDEDMPQLRLNPAYKRLLTRDGNDRDTRNYVKDRYKSAIQLIKNIEQRKQTITKVCYSIVARQQDFLERGIDQLKPMMIKEVAEEIGVHPSTVSRAVANKYVHTQQGVFELRYFFSESVQGPEGGGTSLLILKRRVKKLIEEEDPSRPLTDEQITRILQSQGIQVTRRTVAKYREDMKIPSTHQRRVKK